jgi:hypothetical protein
MMINVFCIIENYEDKIKELFEFSQLLVQLPYDNTHVKIYKRINCKSANLRC